MASFSIQTHTSVKQRFLTLLGEVHESKRSEFHKVRAVPGIYPSKEAVPREPEKIPGAPYWVETNISTPQKAIVLFKVLDTLEYKPNDIVEALRLIVY